MVGRTGPTPHGSSISKVAWSDTTLWSDQICDPINHWVPPSLSPKLGFLLSLTPSLVILMDGGPWVSTTYGIRSPKVARGSPFGSTDQIGQQVAHLGPGMDEKKSPLMVPSPETCYRTGFLLLSPFSIHFISDHFQSTHFIK